MLITEIMATDGYSKVSLGLAATLFFVAYGVGQIFSGLLADRVSPLRLVYIGLLLGGMANIVMGLEKSLWMIQLVWCLNGLSLSLLWAPIIKIISVYIPQRQRKTAAVNISTTIPAGTLAAYGLSALILHVSGNWRTVFFVSGAVAAAIGVIFAVLHRGLVKVLSAAESDVNETVLPVQKLMPVGKKDFLSVLWKGGIVFVVLGVMANGIIKDGVTSWIPTYLREQYNVGVVVSILALAIIPIFNLSGVYIADFVNRKVKNDLFSSAIIYGAAAIVLLALAIGISNFVAATVLLAVTTALMLGVNSLLLSIYPLSFAYCKRTATVSGFLNFTSYAASAVATYAFAAISENYGWGATVWSWLGVAVFGGAMTVVAGMLFARSRRKNPLSPIKS